MDPKITQHLPLSNIPGTEQEPDKPDCKGPLVAADDGQNQRNIFADVEGLLGSAATPM